MKNNNKSFFYLCLHTISWQRFTNAVKVIISYYISLIIKHPINWGVPIVINIESSSICNLKCIECLNGLNQIKREIDFIDIEIYKKFISEISKKSWIINLYFQGEPLINKNIIEMISFAKTKGLMTVISTNGNLITEQLANDLVNSGLDTIIISLDGWNQSTYEAYRKGGSFEKLIQGMKFLAEAKQKHHSMSPSFIAQCLSTSISEKNTAEIKNIATKFGFNFQLKSIQIYNQTDSNQLIPKSKGRYSMKNGQIDSSKKIKNYCRRLWTHTIITSDSQIVACCNDKVPYYIFGNFSTTDFHTILHSKARINFQSMVLKQKNKISICQNCNLS